MPFFAAKLFGKYGNGRNVGAVGYVLNGDIIENFVFVVLPLSIYTYSQMKVCGVEFLKTVEQLRAVQVLKLYS